MTTKAPGRGHGPFRVDQLQPGDRYELSDGHPVYCAPAGGRHARGKVVGGAVLAFDPAVEEAGIDAGYSNDPGTLRAPDVAVGNVPDAPGFVSGAPALALEYADTGRSRTSSRTRSAIVRTVPAGEALTAPGVLKNAVPVEALYDRAAAERVLLANLLQRQDYENLDAVRSQGQAEGRAEGLRSAVMDLCELLGIELGIERRCAMEALDATRLDALRATLKRDRRWPELL